MLNKDLLLCSKGEDVPIKYEYTVDALIPALRLGGIQPGFGKNENVKTPYWGNERNYLKSLQTTSTSDYSNSLIDIASGEPVLGNTFTLKLWLPDEYKEYIFTWTGSASYYNYYFIDGVEVLNWNENLYKKVTLEFSVPPDGYIII